MSLQVEMGSTVAAPEPVCSSCVLMPTLFPETHFPPLHFCPSQSWLPHIALYPSLSAFLTLKIVPVALFPHHRTCVACGQALHRAIPFLSQHALAWKAEGQTASQGQDRQLPGGPFNMTGPSSPHCLGADELCPSFQHPNSS